MADAQKITWQGAAEGGVILDADDAASLGKLANRIRNSIPKSDGPKIVLDAQVLNGIAKTRGFAILTEACALAARYPTAEPDLSPNEESDPDFVVQLRSAS